jgi:very-short-patch-repair endonuclease
MAPAPRSDAIGVAMRRSWPGWRVMRFSYDDVAYDGATVFDRLRAATAARAA